MKAFRILLLVVFLTLISYLLLELNKQTKAGPEILSLTMCDVGQGDAILIQWQSTQVLVDAGRGEKVLNCLWSELPFFDKSLELVVATHPDADHIGGLPLVFDQFSIQTLLLPPVTRETPDFAALRDSISRETELIGRIQIARSGQTIKLSDEITLTILAPLAQFDRKSISFESSPETVLSAVQGFFPAVEGTSNDWSIVLLLQFKQFSALLTADAESRLELALIQAGLVGDVDVLKVGHHGSKSSTSDDFLRAITPETALISVGENNPYGHPTDEVLGKLRSRGVQILRSDQLGTVTIESDGQQYWIAQ